MNPERKTSRRLADVATTRWRNGKGATRELLRIPAHDNPDDFLLRVSVAEVDADAEFSVYPGIDRILTILRGSGMELIDMTEGAFWHAVAGRFSSLTFAGERRVNGRLLDGPVVDFNVMVRRDAGAAELRIVEGARTETLSTCCLLFVAQGSVRVEFNDGSALVLDESHYIEPREAASVATAGNSVAFLVDYLRND